MQDGDVLAKIKILDKLSKIKKFLKRLVIKILASFC